MKTLLFGMLFLPCICFAQKKNQSKGFFAAGFGGELSSDYKGGSLRIMGGINSNDIAFFGAYAGVTRFSGTNTIIPVGVSVILAPLKGKVTPVAIIQPGYGIYKEGKVIETTGGFNLYAGGGIGFRNSNSLIQLTAGYSQFTFTTANLNSYIKCLGIRATITGL